MCKPWLPWSSVLKAMPFQGDFLCWQWWWSTFRSTYLTGSITAWVFGGNHSNHKIHFSATSDRCLSLMTGDSRLHFCLTLLTDIQLLQKNTLHANHSSGLFFNNDTNGVGSFKIYCTTTDPKKLCGSSKATVTPYVGLSRCTSYIFDRTDLILNFQRQVCIIITHPNFSNGERRLELLDSTEHKASMLLKYINFQAEEFFWNKVPICFQRGYRNVTWTIWDRQQRIYSLPKSLQINHTQTLLV